MSSQSSRGLGQGRGSLRTYQIPLPPSRPEIFQIIVEEFQSPGLHSIHIEEAVPIQVTRYSDPDDLLSDRNELTPQQILQQVELIEISVEESPQMTLLSMLHNLQQSRLHVAGIIVGDQKYFMERLGLPKSFRLAMQPLSRSCDFIYLGFRGFVDDSLDRDKVAILGGETSAPTLASVRLALVSNMDPPVEDSDELTD